MKTEVRKDGEVEQRLVWGEVVAPNRPFVPNKEDDSVDFMTADEIQKLAHEFMRRKMTDQVDVQHDNTTVPQVVIVESFIAREGDPDFIPGSWVVCCHVNDDDLWQKVKDGEINGFSIQALVLKEEVEVEVEIPDEVTGTTSTDEGHSHKFKVRFGPDGSFLGGETSTVDGHAHTIVAGTITQPAQGHTHRFSSVDNVVIVTSEE